MSDKNKTAIKPGTVQTHETREPRGAMTLAQADDGAALVENPRAFATPVVGEFDLGSSDNVIQRPPFIKMKYGVSHNAPRNALNGALFLGDWAVKIADPDQPVRVHILGVKAYAREWLNDYSPDVMPQEFASLEEAASQGFRTRWENGVHPEVTEALMVTLLVEKPEDEVNDGTFFVVLDGHEFTPAVLVVEKSALIDVKPNLMRILQISRIANRYSDDGTKILGRADVGDLVLSMVSTSKLLKKNGRTVQFVKFSTVNAGNHNGPATLSGKAHDDLVKILSGKVEAADDLDDER